MNCTKNSFIFLQANRFGFGQLKSKEKVGRLKWFSLLLDSILS
ncbi:hypothetical protein VCRA2128O310_170097 [Vibrio crassostreae]|nr:hypothetical protein VCRA2118O239_110111 [Vibrio crassostreae]CAK1736111.1 hypothetical protein VCRA2112O185_120062 [Vibrio crassostreae]CAK1742974.1 hypothetical protein VCRA2110O173_130054 [Vibrio crassostreae]CAK1783051.1 hypothetical protein VCRA2112O192_160020 [Vibrio crassostreae]CAK1812248.1 hypothetical protein VCRA2116O234_190020 [Vibrio crassostreae]